MITTFDFRLDTNDMNYGTAYFPHHPLEQMPVIIYCHGWGGSRNLNPSTKQLQTSLMNYSIVFVSFDFFGCGQTGGEYAQMTYGRWMSNLNDIVDWVSKQEWAIKEKIGCFAISSGTTAALRLSQSSDKLAFLVSVATCSGVYIGMPNGPGRVMTDNLDELLSNGTASIFNVQFPLEFYKDVMNNAPIYRISEITCPVFFLQGGADNIWRRADAWTGYEQMKRFNLPVKYKELEAGDHCLDNVAEESAKEVVQWLEELNII